MSNKEEESFEDRVNNICLNGCAVIFQLIISYNILSKLNTDPTFFSNDEKMGAYTITFLPFVCFFIRNILLNKNNIPFGIYVLINFFVVCPLIIIASELVGVLGYIAIGLGLFYLLIKVAVETTKSIGRGIGSATSYTLKKAGVNKKAADVIGAVAGGVVVGSVARAAVNNISDTTDAIHTSGNHSSIDPNDSFGGSVNPNQIYVDSYYRNDGTFVEGHQRTVPNDTIKDNISSH